MDAIYHIFFRKLEFCIAKLSTSIKAPSLSNKESVVSFSIKKFFFYFKNLSIHWGDGDWDFASREGYYLELFLFDNIIIEGWFGLGQTKTKSRRNLLQLVSLLLQLYYTNYQKSAITYKYNTDLPTLTHFAGFLWLV